MFVTSPGKSLAQSQESSARKSNGLVGQTSPYLLQHAHNPVNWMPWGKEAFDRAKKEDKPIFLSIGYSTCYWCHVMEVESFEDEEVATVLNEHFVTIKVDREEHPDIDEQYMLATQLITQRGGWPNSVWLTPDGKPWMAGTYFPKREFIHALRQLDLAWKNQRKEVDQQADALSNAIKDIGKLPDSDNVPLSEVLSEKAAALLISRFDSKYGGFGKAPKFPHHGTLQLLFQEYRETDDDSLRIPILSTLDAILLGGIHDHIGGGYHRYATDEQWLLPHFEKMLYDNAQLMRSFVDAFQITGASRYRDAVADIEHWISREMTSPDGAFFSALDSGEVGKEGEAYVWSIDRLRQVMSEEDSQLIAEVYQFQSEGNYREQATGEKTGKNIPHLQQSLESIAQQKRINPFDFAERISKLRRVMLNDRQTWPQPRKDDKIIAGWNGLLIGSLAYAGRVLEEPRYLHTAGKAADFLLTHSFRDQMLLRTHRTGVAKIPGYLDDYAYLAQGLLELYRGTSERRWLDQSERLMKQLLELFEDREKGGLYFTSLAHDDMIVRSKHLSSTGNLPHPAGITAQTLIQLFHESNHPDYRSAAQRILESQASVMRDQPQSVEHLLVAMSQFLAMRRAELTRRVDPVTMQVHVLPKSVKPGDTAQVRVEMAIDDGWHLYGLNPNSALVVASSVQIAEHPHCIVGDIEMPPSKMQIDPILKQSLQIYSGHIAFQVPITIRETTHRRQIKLKIRVTTQACDERRCLAPQVTQFDLPIEIADAATKTAPH